MEYKPSPDREIIDLVYGGNQTEARKDSDAAWKDAQGRLFSLYPEAKNYNQTGQYTLTVKIWKDLFNSIVEERKKTSPSWKAHQKKQSRPQYEAVWMELLNKWRDYSKGKSNFLKDAENGYGGVTYQEAFSWLERNPDAGTQDFYEYLVENFYNPKVKNLNIELEENRARKEQEAISKGDKTEAWIWGKDESKQTEESLPKINPKKEMPSLSGSSAGQQMPGYEPGRPETRSNPVPPPGYSTSDLVRTPYGWAVKYDKTKRPPNLPPVASQERFADYQAEIMQQKGSQNMQLPSISSKQPMPSIGGNTNPGFARPPSNVVGGSVMTRWVNTKTGQTYTAPNAAWVPPSSDWVKVGPTPMFDKPKRQKQGPLLPPPTRGPSGLTPTNIPGLRR